MLILKGLGIRTSRSRCTGCGGRSGPGRTAPLSCRRHTTAILTMSSRFSSTQDNTADHSSLGRILEAVEFCSWEILMRPFFQIIISYLGATWEQGQQRITTELVHNCQIPLQLANPTQLQLVRAGVDFVFPRKKKEGRRKKNPHLASSRRIDPTCLKFGDCLVSVWKVLGNCLEAVLVAV